MLSKLARTLSQTTSLRAGAGAAAGAGAYGELTD